MNDKDKMIIAKLGMIAEIFKEELSEASARAYVEILRPYDIEKLQYACLQIINTRTYNGFPKPANFIKHMEPDQDVLAEQALTKCREMMDIYGGIETVAFDDPVIHYVIRSSRGGWPGFCEDYYSVNAGYEALWDKDFKQKYLMYLQDGQDNEQENTPILMGTRDSLNWDMSNGTVSEPKRLSNDNTQKIDAITDKRKPDKRDARISSIIAGIGK